MHFIRKTFLFFLLFSFAKVNAQQLKVQYRQYEIKGTDKKDSAMQIFLKPYADSLQKSMQQVIGFAVNNLYKKQPEGGALGNFITDAILTMSRQKSKEHIHAALLNSGGVRSFIPKGDITVERIFELMPFDNVVVFQEIDGKILQMLLDKIANDGGWPIAGISFSINTQKKATNILIEGKPISENELYTIALPDYVANGGSNCEMLKPIEKKNTNYLIRDALLDYTKMQTAQGKPIDAKTENRIVYDNR